MQTPSRGSEGREKGWVEVLDCDVGLIQFDKADGILKQKSPPREVPCLTGRGCHTLTGNWLWGLWPSCKHNDGFILQHLELSVTWLSALKDLKGISSWPPPRLKSIWLTLKKIGKEGQGQKQMRQINHNEQNSRPKCHHTDNYINEGRDCQTEQ